MFACAPSDGAGLIRFDERRVEASPHSLRDASHRRLNALTGEWVLVSPHRTQRPWQGRPSPAAPAALAHDPDCYLCPGNRRAHGDVNPDYPHTFVFDNDFPALRADAPAERGRGSDRRAARERRLPGDMFFAAPRSDARPHGGRRDRTRRAGMGRANPRARRPATIRSVQIFENRGDMMGASNPHPHCQMWATRTCPTNWRRTTHRQGEHSGLPAPRLPRARTRFGERVVFANEHFRALVPYWAVWPFETLVLPLRHIGGMDELARGGPRSPKSCAR